MRRGITLIEMLVAMSITLVIMATVVTVFSAMGTSVANSRSTMEMTDRLRQARNLLQDDLANLSRKPTPWVQDFSGGYFEYWEGNDSDKAYLPPLNTDPALQRFGDSDDGLIFTVTTSGRPYQGLVDGSSVESSSAEIVWVVLADTTAAGAPRRTIYRRAMLIVPHLQEAINARFPVGGVNLATFQQFQRDSDCSARFESGSIVLNTLADLRWPANRYLHATTPPAYTPLDGNRTGEDVMMRNALAFDVRIFDSGAPIYSGGANLAFGPSDPGFTKASPPSATPIGAGAYVDLEWGPTYTPGAGMPTPMFNGSPAGGFRFFGTQPADFDDGFDSDGNGVVDDVGERTTEPPYSATPAGLQTRIRTYENDSRQIREVSVNHHFSR